ncbi:hypothetical protein [Deinococcus sp. Leaf326]|uniref:hypothetical protein n=1 Tax=Deinococcus sp. Leaf326 TaxID=1736338 RepID=UPI0009E9B67E|nr:hypothetical protein [Deinococcus sp. Leaf326]
MVRAVGVAAGGHPNCTHHGKVTAPNFRWTLVFEAAHVGAARAALRRLSAKVLAVSPQACWVAITPRGGVRLWDDTGDALDLEALPFDLAEQLLSFFGPGAYRLALADSEGAVIERAYRK